MRQDSDGTTGLAEGSYIIGDYPLARWGDDRINVGEYLSVEEALEDHGDREGIDWYFPPGEHDVGDQWDIPDDCRLIGIGDATITGDASNVLLSSVDSSGVEYHGLHVDSGDCTAIRTGTHCRVINCDLENDVEVTGFGTNTLAIDSADTAEAIVVSGSRVANHHADDEVGIRLAGDVDGCILASTMTTGLSVSGSAENVEDTTVLEVASMSF